MAKKDVQKNMKEDGLDDLWKDDYPPEETKEEDEPTGEGESEGEEAEAEVQDTDDKPAKGQDADDGTQPEDDEGAEFVDKAGKDQPAKVAEAPASQGQGESEEQKEVQTFKYRNKEYTLDDLAKNPDLFTKVVTGANQQSHYQELYEKQKAEAEELQRGMQERLELEQRRQMQEEIEARRAYEARQQQYAQASLTPDIVRGHYAQQVDGMIKEGWLEEDLKEYYPNTAAGIMYMRDTMLTEIASLKRQVAELIGFAQNQHQSAQVAQYENHKRTVKQQINHIFDNIAAEGGIFEPLADQKIRSEFITELQETANPEIKRILENPQILRNYWLAKNHETLVALATQQKVSDKVSPEDARRLVTGEGSANVAATAKSKPREAPAGTAEGWADILD